jgi:outer membrane receptor protein involved in Fe transport
MSLTVDYISINISQAIVTLNATNILDACYDNPTYPNAYCDKVSRGPTGQITLVQTGYSNAGFENFNGITSEYDWSFDLPSHDNPHGFGTIDLRLNYFFQNHLSQAVGAEDVTVLPGSIGNSKHKGTVSINWAKDRLFALWQTRVVGRAIWDNALPSTNSQIQGVGTWWVHNLTLGYNPGSHFKVQLVVDNVFDRQAPFPVPAFPADSTLAIPSGVETYFSGILGRYFVGTLEYQF